MMLFKPCGLRLGALMWVVALVGLTVPALGAAAAAAAADRACGVPCRLTISPRRSINT